MRLHPSFAVIATGAALALLAGCQEEARSESYFEAHETEARAIVADCTAGKVTGKECENASIAVHQLDKKHSFDDLMSEAKKQGF